MYWNIPSDRIFWTGIFLLTEYVVLGYSYSLNILYWNIPTDWIFRTGIFLLTEYLGLKYSLWQNILYWNIPADWINLLEYSYWLHILYWNMPTYWILGTKAISREHVIEVSTQGRLVTIAGVWTNYPYKYVLLKPGVTALVFVTETRFYCTGICYWNSLLLYCYF